MACTLGHIAILKKFLKTNNDYCVVLEDDVASEPLSQHLDEDLPEIFDSNDQGLIFILGGQEGLKTHKYIDWKTPFKNTREWHGLRSDCFVCFRFPNVLLWHK